MKISLDFSNGFKEVSRELLNYNDNYLKGLTYFNKIIFEDDNSIIEEERQWDTSNTAGDFAFERDLDGSERKAYEESRPQYIKDGLQYLITRQKTYTQEEYKKWKEYCQSVQLKKDLGEIELWSFRRREDLRN